MAINTKKKGNHGEHLFAQFLQEHGFKAYKNSSSGGNKWKSDVHNSLDLNIEVKTVKRINLQEAWKQTERDSSLSRNSPLLAIHFDKMDKGKWLIVLHSNDWIELVKESRKEKEIVEIPQTDSREKKWVIQQAIQILKKLLKFYE